MKRWVLSLLTLVSIVGFAQEATKITAGKYNDFGLAYSLPKTIVNVNVEMTKITAKAGPYYKYAEKYLGVKDIVIEDHVAWEINSIRAVPASIADKENSYFIKFKSSNPPSIFLTTEGVLWSVNAEPKATPLDQKGSSSIQNEISSTQASLSVLSEEQLAAGSTAKMAEIAAKQIYRIRESRINLVTGDVDQMPSDGESFKLVMSQLDQQERMLTEMFIGSVKKEISTQIVRYEIPTNDEKEILFRFSKFTGIVSVEDLGGAPIYATFKITEDLREPEGADKKKDKNKGIAYVVPGKGIVTISSGNKTLAESTLQIAQLGNTHQLPANLFDDKKIPAKAVFNPITGAVIEIVQ